MTRYVKNTKGLFVPERNLVVPKKQRGFFSLLPGFLGGSSSGPTDPYWSSVVSLQHFQGSNGSLTFTDQVSGTTWPTILGNAQISTAEYLFGSSSGWTGAPGTNGIVGTASTNFLFTSDLTIECSIYTTSASGGTPSFNIQSGGNELLTIYLDSPTSARVLAGGANIITGIVLPGANVWFSYALVRAGTTLTAYVNGTNAGSATLSGSMGSATINPRVLGNGTQINWSGYVAESRVTNGIARYTANYTVASAPFPNH
jgi:hypothetical protein